MPTIIKTDPVVVRETEVVETDSTNSTLVLLIALLVVGAIAAIGYFAWWAPSREAPAVIDRQTVIHDSEPAPPTIVTPPASQPPIVIEGPQGPKGEKGDPGAPGDSTIIVEPPSTTG